MRTRCCQRAANWEHVLAHGVDIPAGDSLVEGDARLADIAGSLRHREPLLPEDVLAAVFHGLAAQRMRGAVSPGEDVVAFAGNLRGLADALTAFNNYRPGQFVDERVADDIAAERRRENEQ